MTADVGIERLRGNHRHFLEDVAELRRLVAARRGEEMVRLAGALASRLWFDHAGIHTSRQLERLIAAQAVAGSGGGTGVQRHDPPRRVLHVLSQAYSLGGHTRLAWRWIQADTARRHSVVLTRQAGSEVPRALIDAVAGGGGQLRLLRGGNSRQLAAELREASRRADLVVLHVHPDDPLPLLAFADPAGRPPVLHVNHADHVFWLGVAACDAVVHVRESGSALSMQRRGVPPERTAMVPLPLVPTVQQPRSAARAALGLSESTQLLFSMGEPYKYRPVQDVSWPGLLEATQTYLQSHPRVAMLVAGPSGLDEWAAASRATGGRIQALGRVADPAAHRASADVYLDSAPIGSVTAALESGAAGLPVVALTPADEGVAVLSADSPGLDHVLARASTIDDLHAALDRLLADPTAAAEQGARTAEAVARLHTGPGWLAFVEAAYRSAAVAHASGDPMTPPDDDDQPRTELLDRALVGLQTSPIEVPPMVATHVRLTRL